jgi:FAT domain
MTGTIRDQDIEEKMKEFLLDQSGKIENNLKAKCFLKLGMWAKEKIENLTQITISKIFKYFSEATDLNPDNHKAWHQYALLNFEAVQLNSILLSFNFLTN